MEDNEDRYLTEREGEILESIGKQMTERMEKTLQSLAKIAIERMEERRLREKSQKRIEPQNHRTAEPPNRRTTESQSQKRIEAQSELNKAKSGKVSISRATQLMTQNKLNFDFTGKKKNKVYIDREKTRTISIAISIPETEKERRITLFDRIVEDAIGNLYDRTKDLFGYLAVTTDEIYRQINGMQNGEYISSSNLSAIDDSIRKLSTTWVELDVSDHIKEKDYVPELKQAEVGRTVLHGTKCSVRLKNKSHKTGWLISSKPLFYEYSKVSKQIASVPIEAFKTKNVSNTIENIKMRYYLMQRVAQFNYNGNDKENGVDLKLDTIFEHCEERLALEKSAKRRILKKRKIDSIRAILDAFVSSGFLKGYELVKNDGMFYGLRFSQK